MNAGFQLKFQITFIIVSGLFYPILLIFLSFSSSMILIFLP